MIGPKEVRIGNWVDFHGPKKIVVIHEDYVNVETNNIYGKHSSCLDEMNRNLKPIPLTEDWLIKFGFKEAEYGYFVFQYRKLKAHYLLLNPNKGFVEMCFNSQTTAQAPTKYVHQLQNLYYALAGEELKLID